MRSLSTREVTVALLVGLFAPWPIAWLSPYVVGLSAAALGPIVSVLAHELGWSKDQVWPLYRTAAATLSALAYGFVIGFPLGLLLTRRWVACWFAFLVAFLLSHYVGSFYSPLGSGLFSVNLLLPEFWLTLMGTLLFTFIGHLVRQNHAARPARA
jgi:hypothetical protein